jgi:glycosyltransferase involved in cell wall biosynthesis
VTTDLPRTLVVVPAFNEEEAVAGVIDEIRRKAPWVETVVVDDGSSDRTAEVARLAGARVLRLPFNLGVGGAMRAGFRYALAEDFDVVVQIDADGQHDPGNLRELVDALHGADLVMGARFAGEGEYEARGPRRWAMGMLRVILSRIAGTKLTDTTSGFRASGPRAVRLFAEHYPAEYLGDTIEALVIAVRAGCVVRQVPVAMRVRAGGTPSHNFIKSTVYLGRAMLALLFALIRPASTLSVGTARP